MPPRQALVTGHHKDQVKRYSNAKLDGGPLPACNIPHPPERYPLLSPHASRRIVDLDLQQDDGTRRLSSRTGAPPCQELAQSTMCGPHRFQIDCRVGWILSVSLRPNIANLSCKLSWCLVANLHAYGCGFRYVFARRIAGLQLHHQERLRNFE